MEEETLDQVKDLIHNPKWMSARALIYLEDQTKINKEQLAVGIAAAVSFYLMAGTNAQFVANALLTTVPILVTFVFVNEKPENSLLFVYWAFFGITTSLDSSLETNVPAWYLIKVILHAMLFLRPFNYAEKIGAFMEDSRAARNEERGDKRNVFSREEIALLESKGSKSPPPEKPDCEKKKRSRCGISSSSVMTALPMDKAEEKPEDKADGNNNNNDANPHMDVLQQHGKSDKEIPEPPTVESASDSNQRNEEKDNAYHQSPAVFAQSRTDISDRDRFKGVNPMTVDSNYQLRNTSSNTSLASESGFETHGHGAQPNLNDFITFPTNCLVFNGPFDTAITYHMRVINNSDHSIAYAIKGNCIPRVTAYPPSGILKSKTAIAIAVKCEGFKFGEVNTAKDRISFDYVFSDPAITQYSHKLMQRSGTRRRKNILIKYNP